METGYTDLCSNVRARLSKLLSTSAYEYFKEKNFFENLYFIIKFNPQWKLPRLLLKSPARVSKLQSTCHFEEFEGKFLNFSSSLSHIAETLSSVSRNFSGQVVKTSFSVSIGTISGNNFSEDLCFLFFLGHWKKFFRFSLVSWLPSPFFSRASLNWNLRVHRKILREMFFGTVCVPLFYLFFTHWANGFGRSSVFFLRCYQSCILRV